MPSTELARRMGLAQSRIVRMERAEANGTIQLDTLRRAADALDCDFVYFLVPRKALDETVRDRARAKAMATLRPVAHNMRLEDQAVDHADQVDDLADQLIDRRGLWSTTSE